jgi:DNA-binding XRE family transcriptional regulator
MTTTLKPKPIAEDAETVTFSRSEWEAFMEDAIDTAASRDYDAWIARIGKEEARRLCYTAAEVDRLLDGVSPVTIWRERAGLSQAALADAAAINASYLNEIEQGKKPGSVAAIRSLAKALRVPMDHLVAEQRR